MTRLLKKPFPIALNWPVFPPITAAYDNVLSTKKQREIKTSDEVASISFLVMLPLFLLSFRTIKTLMREMSENGTPANTNAAIFTYSSGVKSSLMLLVYSAP